MTDKTKNILADIESSASLGTLHVDSLVPNSWNPQHMDEKTFSRLVDEIAVVGFIAPVTVVDMGDGTYRILGGEHRWRAAQAVGMERVDAKILPLSDWDEDKQKLVTVRLNVLSGDLNPDKFLPLFNEMSEKFGRDSLQELFAFTDDQRYQKLMSEMTKDLKESLPPEKQDEFVKKAKKAKTVDDLADIVATIMEKSDSSTIPNSFLVFSIGKGKQIYVQLNAVGKRAMDRVADYLMFSGEDINDFMMPVLQACLEKAEAAFLTKSEDEAKAVDKDAPPL